MSLLAGEDEQKRKTGRVAADGKWRGKKKGRIWAGDGLCVCVCVCVCGGGGSEDYILLSSKWEKKESSICGSGLGRSLFWFLLELFITLVRQGRVEIKAALHHSSDSVRTRTEMKGAGRGKLIDADLICLNCASSSGAQDISAALWSSLQKENLFLFFIFFLVILSFLIQFFPCVSTLYSSIKGNEHMCSLNHHTHINLHVSLFELESITYDPAALVS